MLSVSQQMLCGTLPYPALDRRIARVSAFHSVAMKPYQRTQRQLMPFPEQGLAINLPLFAVIFRDQTAPLMSPDAVGGLYTSKG